MGIDDNLGYRGTMNGISLFSGTAIGELVFKHIIPGYRTVGYVEWDKHCQDVIRQRIKDGWFDDAPIFGDIREFNERYASLYAGKVDWLSGGFPCQPFSVAGRQLGEADERNMWPATRDAIRILRPRYFLGENVPGLVSHRYIYRVIADLAEIGYDAEWDIVGASDVGANHRRKRWWVIANTERKSDNEYVEKCRIPSVGEKGPRQWGADWIKFELDIGNVAPTKWGCERFGFTSQPTLVRVNDGLATELDARLTATGNGWVPQVVAAILNIERGRP